MSTLKIKYILAGLAFMMFFMVGNVSATHIVGGQLTYRCLGNDQYEVTLTVRIDCINGAEDAPLDDPATIGLYDSFGFLQIALGEQGRLELPLMDTRIITTSLSEDCRLNIVEGDVCVEEAIYTGVVTLPFNKTGGYTLAYQRCCRNVILNNINDPLTTGVTYFSNVTSEALRECNSQPVFNEFPEIFVCAGDKFTFNHTAVDPDGDELRYRFCTPTAGASIDNPNPQTPSTPPYPPVVFANGFSATNPFGPGGSITIDEATGMTMGTPDLLGTYLIGVCVDEFRDGVLLSTTRRDFEYNVVNCSPPIVIDCELTGNDCDGDNTISFINRTTGADSYMWFFDYPNMDPSTTSTVASPTHTYPVAGKYTVRKEAIRDSDGCSVFEEFVLSTGPSMLQTDFAAEFISCDGQNLVGLSDISVDPTGISCAVAWDWTINVNGSAVNLQGNPVTFDAGTATTAEITLNVTSSSGCVTTITRTIDLTDLFPSSSLETVLLNCDNGFTLQLLNSSNSNIASVTATEWTITQGGITTNPTGNPITVNTQGENITVTALSTFSNGCIAEFTNELDQSQFLPVIDILNTGGGNCVASDIYTFSPSISGVTIAGPIASFVWTDSNGNTFNTENISIELAPGETIGLELEVVYQNGCIFNSNDNGSNGPFSFTPEIGQDLVISPTADCNSQGASTSVTLSDNTNNVSAIVSQVWTINGVPQNATSTLTFPVGSADVLITYDVTYANGCTASFSETFDRNSIIPTDQDAAVILSELVSCEGDQVTVSISGGANSANFAESWIINNMAFSGSPVVLTVGANDQLNIEHTLTSAFGCSSTATESFIADSLLPTDQDAEIILTELVSCDDDQITVSISGGPNAVNFTETWVINNMTFSGSPVVITVGANEQVDIEHILTSAVGCSSSANESFIPNSLLPSDQDAEIILTELVSCDDDQITLSISGGPNAANFTETWVINNMTFSGSPVLITVGANEQVDIEHILTSAVGCSSSASESFIANSLIPAVNITNDLAGIDCINPSGQTITLSSGISGSAFDWIIDGQPFNTANPQISVVPGQTVNASVEVLLPNGCSASGNTSFTATNSAGAGDVTITNNRGTEQPCIGANGETIVISASSTGQVSSYAWTCILDGNAIAVNNDPSISVSLLPGQNLSCTVVITNAIGCTSTATTQINTQSSDQVVDVIESVDCSDPTAPQITLAYQQSLGGANASSFEWNVNGNISNGPSVTFPLSAATGGVTASLIVTFDNGCTGSFSDVFDPSSLVPNLDYTATLIECNDGQALYEFNFEDGELLCITLTSLVWTINGQMFTGNPVQVWLPAPAIIDDISVLATYSDNSVFGENVTLPPLNTGLDVTATNIGITQVNSGTGAECNGDVTLEIDNPIPGVVYEWTDADGNIILVDGTTLSTNTNTSGDTILVNFSDNPNCVIGTGSIVIDNIFPPPPVDESFIICPGDTTNINCVPVDAAVSVTYLWKPADQLIGDADQPCPIVGIPETQTEDFSLILCTTNQFGCERSDTIDFEVSTPIDDAFTFAPDSCGSFTYNFMAPEGVFPEGLMWDFGDGNTSSELNPTHTYNSEGEFIVSLDTEGVCLGDIPPATVSAPAIPMINISIDTIMYVFGEPVVLSATTNANPDSITWCNSDGEVIGMGIPLTYEPEMDPETVIAKVVDEFGCTNQTMVVLMSNTSLPPITIPNPPMVACAQEEFPIELDISGFDAEQFNFDWQPANCISTGQGTPFITAATSESKTFTVVVTNIETGQDTTISLSVDIENLQVGIFSNNGIPDQEGLPQVCQGSDITLSADPADPTCDYLWSTGETGDSIIVSPNEDATFSLSCVSANGCEFTTSTDIEVLPPQCNEDDVFVPNAFSPNADNINDRLYVRSKFIREMEFFVLNRWGQEVWRTTDQQQGWDGNFEGEALAPDSYSYCLIVTCVNDQTYTARGNVSIIK